MGVLLNYAPKRVLYVSEPLENSIVAIDLTDDGLAFHVAAVRRIRSNALDQPVDLAPVKIETTDADWASNTTLDVQSDYYVANRGNNTIVRIRQDGTVVAIRSLLIAGRTLGNLRLNGIATSADGTLIWAAVTGHHPGAGHLPGAGLRAGAVLEMPAF